MLPIPAPLQAGYEVYLRTREIPEDARLYYKKWLRFYLDFCQKYHATPSQRESLPLFLKKLQEKRQAEWQRQQAADAVSLYYDLLQARGDTNLTPPRPNRLPLRAEENRAIPVVLSREEIKTILSHLAPPYDLVVKLLYGCGLRLFECLNLRVQCLNFDAGVIAVHDGKGKKDRTVPLPKAIFPELLRQVEKLKGLHRRDLNRKYAGVFLVNALGTKYPNAAKEFIWQWLFPAKDLTRVPETGEYRRYHLHETHVQKAIKEAVGKAQLCKRASAHTFRHPAEAGPAICSKLISTSGRFRNCWVTATSKRP